MNFKVRGKRSALEQTTKVLNCIFMHDTDWVRCACWIVQLDELGYLFGMIIEMKGIGFVKFSTFWIPVSMYIFCGVFIFIIFYYIFNGKVSFSATAIIRVWKCCSVNYHGHFLIVGKIYNFPSCKLVENYSKSFHYPMFLCF